MVESLRDLGDVAVDMAAVRPGAEVRLQITLDSAGECDGRVGENRKCCCLCDIFSRRRDKSPLVW